MSPSSLLPLLLTALLLGACTTSSDRSGFTIVAHRGASGHLPEHTLEAYALAHAQGADMIEPDVVATRDGVLICLHDITLDSTTNVAEVYPDRARADGKWYAIDFDMRELRRLEARGRDGRVRGCTLATLDEMLGLVDQLNTSTNRFVGVVPEMKKPAFHAEEGFDLAVATLEVLAAHGYTSRDDAIWLQCFDMATLRRVRFELGSDLPLMALSGDALECTVLEELGTWCDAFGCSRKLIEPGPDQVPGMLQCALDAGLAVVPYTLKDEPGAVRALRDAGVAGVFIDWPDTAMRALGRD